MTPRPDDEMEAREWAKAHEEKPFDVRWNPAGAYLAGLLAERARGRGTEDERKRTFIETRRGAHDENAEILSDCWDEARIGFVPASEVERLAGGRLADEILRMQEVLKKSVAEAVKRERERCAAIALKYKEVMGPDIAREILTPSGEEEGDE